METPLTYTGTPIGALVAYERHAAGLPPCPPVADPQCRGDTFSHDMGRAMHSVEAVAGRRDAAFVYRDGVPILLQDLAFVWARTAPTAFTVETSAVEESATAAASTSAWARAVMAAVDRFAAKKALAKRLKALAKEAKELAAKEAKQAAKEDKLQQQQQQQPPHTADHSTATIRSQSHAAGKSRSGFFARLWSASRRSSRSSSASFPSAKSRVFAPLLVDAVEKRLKEDGYGTGEERRRAKLSRTASRTLSSTAMGSSASGTSSQPSQPSDLRRAGADVAQTQRRHASSRLCAALLTAYLDAMAAPLMPPLLSRQLGTVLTHRECEGGHMDGAQKLLSDRLRAKHPADYSTLLYIAALLSTHAPSLPAAQVKRVMAAVVREPLPHVAAALATAVGISSSTSTEEATASHHSRHRKHRRRRHRHPSADSTSHVGDGEVERKDKQQENSASEAEEEEGEKASRTGGTKEAPVVAPPATPVTGDMRPGRSSSTSCEPDLSGREKEEKESAAPVLRPPLATAAPAARSTLGRMAAAGEDTDSSDDSDSPTSDGAEASFSIPGAQQVTRGMAAPASHVRRRASSEDSSGKTADEAEAAQTLQAKSAAHGAAMMAGRRSSTAPASSSAVLAAEDSGVLRAKAQALIQGARVPLQSAGVMMATPLSSSSSFPAADAPPPPAALRKAKSSSSSSDSSNHAVHAKRRASRGRSEYDDAPSSVPRKECGGEASTPSLPSTPRPRIASLEQDTDEPATLGNQHPQPTCESSVQAKGAVAGSPAAPMLPGHRSPSSGGGGARCVSLSHSSLPSSPRLSAILMATGIGADTALLDDEKEGERAQQALRLPSACRASPPRSSATMSTSGDRVAQTGAMVASSEPQRQLAPVGGDGSHPQSEGGRRWSPSSQEDAAQRRQRDLCKEAARQRARQSQKVDEEAGDEWSYGGEVKVMGHMAPSTSSSSSELASEAAAIDTGATTDGAVKGGGGEAENRRAAEEAPLPTGQQAGGGVRAMESVPPPIPQPRAMGRMKPAPSESDLETEEEEEEEESEERPLMQKGAIAVACVGHAARAAIPSSPSATPLPDAMGTLPNVPEHVQPRASTSHAAPPAMPCPESSAPAVEVGMGGEEQGSVPPPRASLTDALPVHASRETEERVATPSTPPASQLGGGKTSPPEKEEPASAPGTFVLQVEKRERTQPRLHALHLAKQSFLSGLPSHTPPAEAKAATEVAAPSPFVLTTPQTPQARGPRPAAAATAHDVIAEVLTHMQQGQCNAREAAQVLLSLTQTTTTATSPSSKPSPSSSLLPTELSPNRKAAQWAFPPSTARPAAEAAAGPSSKDDSSVQVATTASSSAVVDNATLVFVDSLLPPPQQRLPTSQGVQPGDGASRPTAGGSEMQMAASTSWDAVVGDLKARLQGLEKRLGDAEEATCTSQGQSTAAEVALHEMKQRFASLEREQVRSERGARLTAAKLKDLEYQLEGFREEQLKLRMLLTETQMQNAKLRNAIANGYSEADSGGVFW